MTFTAAAYVVRKDQMKIRQMLTKGSVAQTNGMTQQCIHARAHTKAHYVRDSLQQAATS